MSPGATKLLALGRGCCVWPRGSLDDPRMEWCGEPVEHAGAPYCAAHAAKSRAEVGTGEDTGALDEIIEVEAGARYRLVVARGRNLGDKRVWRVVRGGPGGTQRRSPDSVVDAAVVTAPAELDGAVRAAHGFTDAE